MTKWARAAIAGPPGVLVAANVLLMLLSVAGRDPVWKREVINLSEAAALADAAEVSRLIAVGGDPLKPYWIRPRLIPESYALGPATRNGLEMTPMQAAAAAGRAEIVDLLLDEGVPLSTSEWQTLACGSPPDVRAALLRRHGNPALDCQIGESAK